MVSDSGKGSDSVGIIRKVSVEDKGESKESVKTKNRVKVEDQGKSKERLFLTLHEESYKKNWPLLVIVFIIAIGNPFLSLPQIQNSTFSIYFSGMNGIIVNLGLNIIALILGFLALVKIVKIEKRIVC